jgi:hypothetical protein
MGLFSNVRGTTQSLFQIQKGGANLVHSSGAIHVKNAANSAFADFNALGLISGDASQAGSVVIYGDANKVTFAYASGQSDDSTYTWPKPDAGKFLKTDGSGNLSWDTPPSAPTDIVHVASKAFVFGTSSPFDHKEIPIGAIVTKVQVIIDEAFNDAAATLKVGKAGATDKYMATTENDLAGAAGNIYEAQYGNAAVSGSAEQIICTLSPGSADEGAGRVLVYYVIPEVL